MEIGISTSCFFPRETEKSIDDIAAAGFKTIEVFVNADFECKPQYINALRNKIDAAGLSVYSFHPHTSFAEPYLFFTPYSRKAQDGYTYYRYLFEAGAKLGAKVFNYHGALKGYNGGMERYAEVYLRLSEYANECNIVFAQENVCRNVGANLDFIKQLAELLDDKVFFTFDVKQAIRSGINPMDMLCTMGKQTVNFHISDSDGKNDCLLPGKGKADLKSLVAKAEEFGYKGPAITEVYSQCWNDLSEIASVKKSI